MIKRYSAPACSLSVGNPSPRICDAVGEILSEQSKNIIRVNCIRTTENGVHWGKAAVTTVITRGCSLIPRKQGAVNQQRQ